MLPLHHAAAHVIHADRRARRGRRGHGAADDAEALADPYLAHVSSWPGSCPAECLQPRYRRLLLSGSCRPPHHHPIAAPAMPLWSASHGSTTPSERYVSYPYSGSAAIHRTSGVCSISHISPSGRHAVRLAAASAPNRA